MTDYDTGLRWEQKTDDGTVHDKDNTYTWNTTLGGTTPDGTAFTSFLGTLNNGASNDQRSWCWCLAGHCDWRLPSIVQLPTIIDLSGPGCGGGSACIDQTVFGPTVAGFNWSDHYQHRLPEPRPVAHVLRPWVRGRRQQGLRLLRSGSAVGLVIDSSSL